MERKRNHQNLTSTSANSVFRNSVNKAEQDLLLKQIKEQRERTQGSNSAVKHENVVSKVAGPKKEARKHRSDSKPSDSETPADFSVKQTSKRLAGCCIKAKVMLAAMKMIKTTRLALASILGPF